MNADTPKPNRLPRNIVILGLVSLLNDFASEMVVPLIPLLLVTVLAAGPAALGMIEGMADLLANLLKLWSGRVSDRAGRRRKPLVIAGYLLWIGSFAPGGAFQAGAVLAGGIVLWLLADGGRTALPRSSWLRFLLSLGLAVFIAVAAGVMMIPGGRLLEYPPAHAGTLILLIESAALISIALTLAALFVGGRPPEEPNAEGGARLKKRPDEH